MAELTAEIWTLGPHVNEHSGISAQPLIGGRSIVEKAFQEHLARAHAQEARVHAQETWLSCSSWSIRTQWRHKMNPSWLCGRWLGALGWGSLREWAITGICGRESSRLLACIIPASSSRWLQSCHRMRHKEVTLPPRPRYRKPCAPHLTNGVHASQAFGGNFGDNDSRPVSLYEEELVHEE